MIESFPMVLFRSESGSSGRKCSQVRKLKFRYSTLFLIESLVIALEVGLPRNVLIKKSKHFLMLLYQILKKARQEVKLKKELIVEVELNDTKVNDT